MAGGKRGRDVGLDAARGLGIALVIVAHALEALFLERPDGGFATSAFAIWQAIYAFHMPLFFLLSGEANRDIAAKSGRAVLRGSLRLVLLAWICQVVGAGLAVALGRVPRDPGAIVEALFRPIIVGWDWSTAVIWFLVALAVARLIVHALTARRSGAAMAAAVVALGLGVWALVDPRVEDVQQVRTWVVASLFFALGVGLGRRPDRLPRPFVGGVMLALALGLAPLNLGCRWSPLDVCGLDVLDGHAAVVMVGGWYGNLPMALVTALLGAVGARALAAGLGDGRAARLGRISLELFLLNGFVLVFVGPIAKTVSVASTGGLALHVVAVALAVPLHVALVRLLPGLLAGLIGSAGRMADRLMPEPPSMPRA